MYNQTNPLLSYLYPSLLSLLGSILLTWGCLSSAHAFYVGAVEVKVVDASQNSLPSYNHRGQHYVMGRYNQRYMLKVINHSSQRLELVMTVDGRDVINGSAGHYGNRGYVLNPHSHFNIEGFRRSDTEVAAFRFTTPGDSYAGRLGAGTNIGVIGVALFSEQEAIVQVPTYPKKYGYLDDRVHQQRLDNSGRARENANVDLDSVAEPSSSNHEQPRYTSQKSRKHSRRVRRKRPENHQSEIGTRYGERRQSRVENTQFIRSSEQPNQVLVIHYDSEQGLRRRGIITLTPSYPTAFPNENRYAPPPPSYR